MLIVFFSVKRITVNPVNTDLAGAIESVHINAMSVLSGLNLQKM